MSGFAALCDDSTFGGKSEDDIKRRGQFADLGASEWFVRGADRFAGFRIANGLIDPIAFVAGMPLNVALGRELVSTGNFDSKMNVRSPSRIRDRLDRAEQIFSGRTGGEPSETLEVLVPLLSIIASRVQIGPIVVGLPDFDDRVPNRFAMGSENLPTQVSHLTHPRRQAVVQHQQIIVGVERQLVGIERPLGLRGSPGQLLREEAGDGQQHRAERTGLQELTPAGER